MNQGDKISGKPKPSLVPLYAFVIAITAALGWILFSSYRFSGDKLFNQYYYVAPIIIPFVLFLFERIERYRNNLSLPNIIIDVIVLTTAMWRVIGDVPFVSGHVIFLTYAIFTSSRWLRGISILVLIEVLYLKLFVWNDWITPIGGTVIGTLAWLAQKITVKDSQR